MDYKHRNSGGDSSSVSSIEDILARLTGVRKTLSGYQSFCPAHEQGTGHSPSLSVSEKDDKILIKCFANCATQDVVAALNLRMSDLFLREHRTKKASAPIGSPMTATQLDPKQKVEKIGSKIERIYPYTDETGYPLFESLRFTEWYADGTTRKTFRQRQAESTGKWKYSLAGVRRVVYRLQEIAALQKSDDKSSTFVFIVEGEKDVENLAAQGLVATCNPMGAGKWVDEYSESLRGLHCVVIPDNDAVGREHGLLVARSLSKTAASVRLAELPESEDKGDVSDWLEKGHGGRELVALVERTPLFDPALVHDAVDDGRNLIWRDIVPFREQLLPVPPFEPDLLPKALRNFTADIADRMQCPVEYVAAALVITAAACIGNRVRMFPMKNDSWQVVVNTWGAVIGQPGRMKSPALNAAMEPLKARERLAHDEHAASVDDSEFAELEFSIRRDALRKSIKEAVKEGACTKHLRVEYKALKQAKRVRRRYIINDVTVEKLGVILNENPNGVLMFRDEVVGLLRYLDREENSTARAFILECWNGYGSYVFDRIGRGETRIENVTLSILGGIQPGPLASYIRGAVHGKKHDDGLLQRFQILFYPDTRRWRLIDRKPDEDAKRLAFACFGRLDTLEVEKDLALRFDAMGQEAFYRWFEEHQQYVDTLSSEQPALAAHLAKYRSLMPSLALIFHLIDEVGSGTTTISSSNRVSIEATERAAAWCKLLECHARRIYAIAGAPGTDAMGLLVDRIREGKLKSPFTIRDVQRKQWLGLGSQQECASTLLQLEVSGYVQGVEHPAGRGGGRPTTVYFTHPDLLEGEVD